MSKYIPSKTENKNRLIWINNLWNKEINYCGMLTTYRNIHSIRCGLHSGFPKCCIKYFINEWKGFGRSSYSKKIKDLSWGYVPCPECHKNNNQIQVKNCRCGPYKSQVVHYKIINEKHKLVETENIPWDDE